MSLNDKTWYEVEAEDYLLGDKSARQGAALIGVGLAVLVLAEQVQHIRHLLDPAPGTYPFLEREVTRLHGEVVRERQLRREAEAKAEGR